LKGKSHKKLRTYIICTEFHTVIFLKNFTEKISFAKVSKNVAKYRFENNFVVKLT